MAAWELYDYRDSNGKNRIAEWSRTLQKPDLARFNRKLKMLEDNGPALGPRLLAGPIEGHAHIYKLRINGRVALRPLLCKGPIKIEKEFTFLIGALEQDRKLQPPNAPSQAEDRRKEIIADNGSHTRCKHEQVY